MGNIRNKRKKPTTHTYKQKATKVYRLKNKDNFEIIFLKSINFT